MKYIFALLLSLVSLTAQAAGPFIWGANGAYNLSLGLETSGNVLITNNGTLRLYELGGGDYVSFQAPSSLAASYTLTFPTTDGASGEFLQTDGSGILTWATAGNQKANIRAPEGTDVVLVNADNHYQVFDLTADINVDLPTTGVVAGDVWTIRENTGAFTLTIRSSGANTIVAQKFGTTQLVALVNTPTAATDWTIVSPGAIYGVQDIVSVTPGYVGEYISSYIPEASAVNVLHNTGTSITSISLTPGDWDVSFVGQIKGTQPPGVSNITIGINLVAGVIFGPGDDGTRGFLPQGTYSTFSTLTRRVQVATGTVDTYYLNMLQDTGNTWQGWGRLSARRVR